MNTVASSLQGSRVLVTGGSGFIGTNLIQSLEASGATVLNVDNTSPRYDAHRAVWLNVSVLDPLALGKAFQEFGPRIVVHLAARTDLDGRTLMDYSVNVEGVDNVVQAVRVTDSVERSIYASTRLVLGRGATPGHDRDYSASTMYGLSKSRGEEIVRAAASDVWTIVRPTGIWGPWFGTPYREFFSAIERGWYVHPGERQVRKSLGYVGNTVHQLIALMSLPSDVINGRTVWLTDYSPIVVRDWADRIREHLGGRRIRTVSVPLLRLMSRAGDGLQRIGLPQVPLTTFRLSNLLADAVYDARETERVVGPLPYSVEEGIRLTVEWCRHTAMTAPRD